MKQPSSVLDSAIFLCIFIVFVTDRISVTIRMTDKEIDRQNSKMVQ